MEFYTRNYILIVIIIFNYRLIEKFFQVIVSHTYIYISLFYLFHIFIYEIFVFEND